jgi:predicted metal-dependent enzyme (double-stranded beta helix superfamily)
MTALTTKASKFELDGFISDCRDALRDSTPQKAVQQVLARALSEPDAVLAELGEPQRAEVEKLHHSKDLTILKVIWAPYMTVMPHDHRMRAVIGLYVGREDNIYWRRTGDYGGRIEAAGAQELGVGDVAPLGKDIVHSVTNPVGKLNGAIHIYLGDFFTTPRSEWDPETLLEGPYDVEKTMRMFEEANRRST